MRDYGCSFDLEGKKITPWACWSKLRQAVYKKDSYILIDSFTQKETRKYIELIVRIINEVQPCELIEVEDKKYIRYKLIGLYDNDLILLNFIRYLWNEYKLGMSVTFFKELDKIKDSEITGMEKLLTANQRMCEHYKFISYGDHSNAQDYTKLVIRKAPEDYYTKALAKGSTRLFLFGE